MRPVERDTKDVTPALREHRRLELGRALLRGVGVPPTLELRPGLEDGVGGALSDQAFGERAARAAPQEQGQRRGGDGVRLDRGEDVVQAGDCSVDHHIDVRGRGALVVAVPDHDARQRRQAVECFSRNR